MITSEVLAESVDLNDGNLTLQEQKEHTVDSPNATLNTEQETTKSGKQATKGQKQIVEENAATLKFYSTMFLGTSAAYMLSMIFFWGTTTMTDIVLFTLAVIVEFGAYSFMAYMAKAKYSETGQLLDGGIDLNMEAGIAEHIKDLIILTSGVLVFAIFSRYFWLLWLTAPARLAFMGWKNFLAPWIFSPPPATEEVNEKKQRKMERRMRRQQ
nr:EOG090X0IGL [Eulimnadia texana]